MESSNAETEATVQATPKMDVDCWNGPVEAVVISQFVTALVRARGKLVWKNYFLISVTIVPVEMSQFRGRYNLVILINDLVYHRCKSLHIYCDIQI